MGLDISKETSDGGGLRWGHTVVGKTAKPLCTGFESFRGILLRCPGPSDPGEDGEGNTSSVFVGGRGVTADRDEGTGGIPIIPGNFIELPISDPAQLYVISQDDDQDVAWIGL